jgi:hypothetical protein
VLLLLGVLLALPMTAHAQENDASPLSLDDYRHTVEQALALLQAEPPRFDEARRLLSSITSVALANGERVTVAPLLRDGIAVEAAQARLRIVLSQLDNAAHDRTAERLAALDQVFADPAFQHRESLLDQVRRWLSNLFSRLIPESQPSAGVNPVGERMAQLTGWVVVGVAATVLLLLLVRWLQTVLRAFVADSGRQDSAADGVPATPAAARQAASRFARGGDYRSAVRHLYLAALMTLQERRVVPRDPSLTNREVLARTPTDAPIHTPLAAVVDVFDNVWYGVHEPDVATFEHYRATVDELARAAAPASGQEGRR